MITNKSKELSEFLEKEKEKALERQAQRMAEKLSLPYLDLSTIPIQLKALDLIAFEKAKQAKTCPLYFKKNKLALAILDLNPLAEKIIKDLRNQGLELEIYIVSLKGLNYALSFYKYVIPKGKKITGQVEVEQEKIKGLIKQLTTFESFKTYLKNFKEPQVSRVLEIILAGSLANKSSDVHFEPEKEICCLRLRIDGILHNLYDLDLFVYQALVSRIKLLSGLKLNVRERPQDGRFSLKILDKEIEIRTSTIPSEYGETIVLRLLDPSFLAVGFENLGFRQDDFEIISQELKKPNGMILNTGPTGCGKTTTLYGFLKNVHKPTIKIITIEDPIEYHLSGIEQTQVDSEQGYDFSNGLRSILRQDPDVILVGEIRDLDTAQIALHAALTGHLVFSTLHTNQAAGAIPRLIDLGVEPSIISPGLNLIIAQRLIRKLCPDCKEETTITPLLEKKIKKIINNLPDKINKKEFENFKIFKAKGCSSCQNFGYQGRIGIFEILCLNTDLKQAIHKNVSEMEIQNLAKKQGMITLQQDGLFKVLKGITSLEELERETGPITIE